MPERAILRDRFSQLRVTAESAAQEYERLAQTAGAEGERAELERLARNERQSVELAERLLEIVEE